MEKRFTLSAFVMVLAAGAGFTSHAATYTISVDAATSSGSWNRFYEESIGSCHPITVLHSSYGRNTQTALRRGNAECGFKRIRAHGILGDAAVYSENQGNPVYNWTTLDSIYDSVTALGMRVIVEISGMPPVLASGTQTAFWYNGLTMNITPPKDYNKWRNLVTALVQHLEQRYGVNEIRNNWLFEVWNEPNLTGTFFTGTIQDYLKMYDYASEGVRLADSLCKIGGPATSGGDPGWVDQFSAHVVSGTNGATGLIGSKCDFVSYHRYADDGTDGAAISKLSSPVGMNEYHKAMWTLMKKNSFKGKLLCTEWAPTYKTLALHSDKESSGSFIAKTIHLLADNDTTQYPLPAVYSFWCISDIFEEWNAGTTTAFDSSYGLCLRGDKNIPASWDVPKASYNAYRLLHKMTDTRISLTGGTTGDGVNGFATLSADNKSMQVLLYNHVDGGAASSSKTDSVVLTVNNIPFLPGNVKVEYWLMDSSHSNAYHVWQALGSPKIPTATQWTQIKTAADLAYAEVPDTITLAQKTFTKKFHCNIYSVGLIVLTSVSTTAACEREKSRAPAGPSVSMGKTCITVFSPNLQSKILKIFDVRGKLVIALNNSQHGYFRIDRSRLGKGPFIAADDKGVLPKINPLVIVR
jgi:xylan 1,4-beta-xylosidase